MMSRQLKRIQLSLLGALLLGSLAGIYLMIWRRFAKPKPTPPATIIKHPVNTPSEDTLKYWTADKKRNIRAADLPNVNALDQEKKHPRHP